MGSVRIKDGSNHFYECKKDIGGNVAHYTNLIELAEDIDSTIENYLLTEDTSDPYAYDRCIRYTMKVMINKTGGYIHPGIMETMIRIHRKPFEERGMVIPC